MEDVSPYSEHSTSGTSEQCVLDSNSSYQQNSQVHGRSDSDAPHLLDLDHTYSSDLPFSDPNAWNDEPLHSPDLVEQEVEQESTSTFPVKHSTTTHSSSVDREVQTDHTCDPTGSRNIHEDDSATRLQRRGKVPNRETSRNNAADDGGTRNQRHSGLRRVVKPPDRLM